MTLLERGQAATQLRIAAPSGATAASRGNATRLKKCGAYCGEKGTGRKGHFSSGVPLGGPLLSTWRYWAQGGGIKTLFHFCGDIDQPR